MAFRAAAARGERPAQSPRGERSASPCWKEGRSPSRKPRPESAGREAPGGGGSPAVQSPRMPACYAIGDFVAYMGPNYTFPGSGVTLRHGMEGEVVGHGTNVPSQYEDHAFLSVQFFGHSSTTNVPPDALAPCVRPPSSGHLAPRAPTSLRGVPDFLESPRPITPRSPKEITPRRDRGGEARGGGDEGAFECCSGPRPPRGEGGRPERGGCDVLSFLDAFFGDEAYGKVPPQQHGSQNGAAARTKAMR